MAVENSLKTSKVIKAEKQLTAHKIKQMSHEHSLQFENEREEADMVTQVKSSCHREELDKQHVRTEKESEAKASMRIANYLEEWLRRKMKSTKYFNRSINGSPCEPALLS